MDETSKESIFVALAAHNEKYLEFTLNTLFDNACEPERVWVGVFDQSPLNRWEWIQSQWYHRQVRYLHTPPETSRGACWARSVTQSLWDKEDIYLQVDSHTWFLPQWDSSIRWDHQVISRKYPRYVLSTVLLGFGFDDDCKPYCPRNLQPNKVTAVVTRPEVKQVPDNCIVRKTATQIDAGPAPPGSRHYSLGHCVAGGFMLAPGEWVRALPYDPELYFEGEEQSLALRAFTHGWTILNPQFSETPFRHYYVPKEEENTRVHWLKSIDENRSVRWWDREKQARARLRDLLQNQVPAPWGLGSARSLMDFAEYSGINYITGEISHPTPQVITLENDR